ncbi:hypothetical protein K1719_044878 [Acacia pycnantha]|nr:hypothetical protein K1719_044878 [Acacia pycnantha]
MVARGYAPIKGLAEHILDFLVHRIQRWLAVKQGLLAGRIPGLSEPDEQGWRTYRRPDEKSGGHGVGWSPIIPYTFRVPQDWEVADLVGTEIDLRFASSKEGRLFVIVAPVLRFSDDLAVSFLEPGLSLESPMGFLPSWSRVITMQVDLQDDGARSIFPLVGGIVILLRLAIAILVLLLLAHSEDCSGEAAVVFLVKRSRRGRKILNYITRALASCLIGAEYP